jgi:hypothetical protein
MICPRCDEIIYSICKEFAECDHCDYIIFYYETGDICEKYNIENYYIRILNGSITTIYFGEKCIDISRKISYKLTKYDIEKILLLV